jgi:hypothetical protein
MAFLIFNDATTRKTRVGSIDIDVTVTDNHSLKSIVTNHPVEDGSNLSDHVYNEPDSYSMQGMITNTPLRGPGLLGFGGTTDSVQTVFDALRKLRDDKIPFTVITSLRRYENMVFSDINIPRDSQTGQTLRFSATMIQIVTVSVETTTLSELGLSEGLKDSGTPTRDRGKQVTSPATTKQTENASLLYKAGKGTVNYFNINTELFGQ